MLLLRGALLGLLKREEKHASVGMNCAASVCERNGGRKCFKVPSSGATRLRTRAEPLEPSSSPTVISRRCWNSIRRWLSPWRGSVCGSRNRTSAFACHQDDRPFCPGRQESDGQHRMTHTLMMKMIALRRGHRDPAATMNDGVLCHVHSIIRWKLQRFSLVGRHLGHVIHYLNESAA